MSPLSGEETTGGEDEAYVEEMTPEEDLCFFRDHLLHDLRSIRHRVDLVSDQFKTLGQGGKIRPSNVKQNGKGDDLFAEVP